MKVFLFMVKETLAYKNCKRVTQIFTLIGIMMNISAIALNIYNYKMLRIESVLMMGYYITHTELGLFFLASNLIIMIFASCGITSARKSLMVVYNKISLGYSGILTLFVIYFMTIFKIEFESRAGEATNSNSAVGGLILGMFSNATPAVALKLTTNQFYFILMCSCACDIISVGINLLTVAMAKIILRIKITQAPTDLPKMESAQNVGLTTGSLKKMRIISLDDNAIITI